MGEALLVIFCSLLMLVGLAGIILPFVPGVPLVWLGLFIYALITGFDTVSVTAVVIFFVLMAVTLVLDFAGPIFGLKKYKASPWSMVGSFLGLILGIILFGFWGVIIGPLAGAFIGELLVKKQLEKGLMAALGALWGFVFGNLLKIGIALIMIGYFILSFFR